MNGPTRIALALSALALGACHREAPQPESTALVAPGMYRAVLELPAGGLPFGVGIGPAGAEAAATVGYLVNGKERVRLSEVTVTGAHLEIRMPGYETRLVADAKDGRLLGEGVLSQGGGHQQQITLHGQVGEASPL